MKKEEYIMLSPHEISKITGLDVNTVNFMFSSFLAEEFRKRSINSGLKKCLEELHKVSRVINSKDTGKQNMISNIIYDMEEMINETLIEGEDGPTIVTDNLYSTINLATVLDIFDGELTDVVGDMNRYLRENSTIKRYDYIHTLGSNKNEILEKIIEIRLENKNEKLSW